MSIQPVKLCIPVKSLDQHLVMLGKTGSGKSSALRHVVEHLLAHNKRVCIIDPKGDWWGLKVDADGKGPGLPVILFGDFKNEHAQDVPINPQSGKHIADLVATGNRPCVIGFRGWSTHHMQMFWIDFAATLFARNAGELFLVGDEFHNFAPKGKVLSPQAGESLHWSNRLLSEGRGLGLVCLLASQRPQKVHNDTLTSCETLAAMRVIHKADRDAVKDWIDGAGDPKLGTEVLNSLAGMPRGEAYVWSPEIGFGPERIKFPMFQTFDSFAPPQLQRKVSNKGWADVDLAAVKDKLAAVIEEQKANDPKELKKQLAAVQGELRKLLNAPVKPQAAKVEVKTVEKFIVKDSQINAIDKLTVKLDAVIPKAGAILTKLAEQQQAAKGIGDQIADQVLALSKLINAARGVNTQITPAQSARSAFSAGKPAQNIAGNITPRAPRESVSGQASEGEPGQITGPMQKILDAYAFWHSIGVKQPTRENIAPLAGYSNMRSSGFRNPLYSCQASGLVENDALTDAGKAAANWPEDEDIDSLEKYHTKLKAVMDGPVARLFDLLHSLKGATDRPTLAAAAGYENHRSSGFRNPLYRLSSMGLVVFGKGETVQATDLMYPEGLK